MDDINAPVMLRVEDNPGDVRLVREALGESVQLTRMRSLPVVSLSTVQRHCAQAEVLAEDRGASQEKDL
jgi:hypothetical protein